MGIFDSFRRTRANLSAPETLATLEHMENFFQGGANWTQGAFHRRDGTKCLVGAANHVRVTVIDDAKYWLRQAIAERTGGAITGIVSFNDSRQSFDEIAAVIARAKELAAARLPAPTQRAALPAPQQVLTGEILQPRELDAVRARRPSLFDWKD